jgi:hypothetical protein
MRIPTLLVILISLSFHGCSGGTTTTSSSVRGFSGIIDDLVPIPAPKNMLAVTKLEASLIKNVSLLPVASANRIQLLQKSLLEGILEIDGIPRSQLRPIMDDILSDMGPRCGGASCERVFGLQRDEIDQFLDDTFEFLKKNGSLFQDTKSYQTLLGSFKRNNDDRILPLGGNEPPYEPAYWNNSEDTMNAANCYAYAVLQVCSKSHNCKIQPGEISRLSRDKPFFRKMIDAIERAYGDELDADFIISQVKKDLGKARKFYKTTANAVPPKGFRKVALVIAPNQDYHWYMQNAEGFWSHKPGFTEVTNRDASDRVIWNPEKANRNYYNIVNYSQFAGYFMVE